jgi:hypothetical protein
MPEGPIGPSPDAARGPFGTGGWVGGPARESARARYNLAVAANAPPEEP